MSQLPFQIDISSPQRTHFVSALAPEHQQVSRLLAHAMSLVQCDQGAALELVRQASALASDQHRLLQHAEPARRGGLAPWQADRVRRYIDRHYANRISLEELAQLARLSSSYFSVAFRVTFRTSPHDYVCKRRVRKAMDLMIGTDNPLSEIALDCGFADQPHLSRVFKRVTNQTPAAWRRDAKVAVGD